MPESHFERVLKRQTMSGTGGSNRMNTHNKLRSRPMTYDESCWGCLLDDHLYEEEEDELAKIIGEERPEESNGFMGMFMFYAAPTISEEEDPRTMRLPVAISSQESHKGLSEQTYQRNTVTYEIPPVTWLQVPAEENEKGKSPGSVGSDKYQAPNTDHDMRGDARDDEEVVEKSQQRDAAARDIPMIISAENSFVSSKDSNSVAVSNLTYQSGTHDGEDGRVSHTSRAVPSSISVYSNKASSVSESSKLTHSTASRKDESTLLRKGISMLRGRSLARLAKGLLNTDAVEEEVDDPCNRSAKSKAASKRSRDNKRSGRSRSAALARHRSKSRGRTKQRDPEEKVPLEKPNTRLRYEPNRDMHGDESSTHGGYEELQKSRSRGAPSLKRSLKQHSKLRLF